MQEGYGFVSFESDDAVIRAINTCQNVVVQGITLKCTITHQHNPHGKKGKKSSPTASTGTATALAMMNMHNTASKYSFPHAMPHSHSPHSTMHAHSAQPQHQRQRESDSLLYSSVGSANNEWNSLRPAATFSSLNPPVPIPGQLSLSLGGGTASTLSSPLFSTSSSLNSTPLASSIASYESSDHQEMSRALLLGSTSGPTW